MNSFDPDTAIAGTFDGLYGLRILSAGDEEVTATVAVRPEILQPGGLVHGGVYAAVAESLASYGTVMAVWDDGMIAVGLSNHTSFLRPVTAGHLHARAQRRHRGRTTWVWEVEILDDEDRLCTLTRVTMAVRPRPGAEPKG
jgi:1,4-dihydroxy-2-naphthoyl-CoA hydrolase